MKKGFTVTAGAKSAFTLAEVLITLTIIGVVAALTIPSITTSTGGRQYQAGAQKAMATISQAMTMRVAMSGEEWGDFIRATPNAPNDMRLLAYLACPTSSVIANVGAQNNNVAGFVGQNVQCTNGVGKPALSLDGSQDLTNLSDTVKFKDGMTSQFNHSAPFNYIAVDTNGEKGPTRQAGQGLAAAGDPQCTGWNPDGRNASTIGPIDATNPVTNNCPDIVIFRIDGDGEVIPADQRTRNILATGNARTPR